MTRMIIAGCLAVALVAGTAPAQQVGPMTLPPPPVIHRIPLHPKVPPPPLPPVEIIKRFTENEAKYRDAFKQYNYQETIRVEEMGNQGPSGMFQVELALYMKPDGHRYGRLLSKSTSTLQELQLSSQDLEVLAEIPLFPLAGDASADYNFTYRAEEKIDELDTYAFLVQPKNMQPGRSYFNGVVWVDNQDLAIVKSYGQFVTSEQRSPNALPFVFFETYRENTEGKYWFPIYISSDDVLRKNGDELPIRLIVRMTDLKPAQPQPTPAVSH